MPIKKSIILSSYLLIAILAFLENNFGSIFLVLADRAVILQRNCTTSAVVMFNEKRIFMTVFAVYRKVTLDMKKIPPETIQSIVAQAAVVAGLRRQQHLKGSQVQSFLLQKKCVPVLA